ncbi:aminopeptidase N, partial [Pantoea agglomerans]|nr:aminopeptidase N [Pantoea agglomerans]
TQQPQIKYRHDYRAPEYTITDIDLTFELDASTTRVTAISQVKRLDDSQAELRLDGEALTLIALEVDGQAWTAFREEEGALVISQLPESFTLKIINDIHPDQNTALEGLYKSGEALCTQCEAEG